MRRANLISSCVWLLGSWWRWWRREADELPDESRCLTLRWWRLVELLEKELLLSSSMLRLAEKDNRRLCLSRSGRCCWLTAAATDDDDNSAG
jgi:hypothetical protein